MIVVVGGANLDILARSRDRAVPATSNPGRTLLAAGGVGRNVAENLARLGSPVALVATVGADAFGDLVLATTAAAGVDVAHVVRGSATGTYTAVLDGSGDLVVGVADMPAVDELVLPAEVLAAAETVVLDGNLGTAVLDAALDLAGDRAVVEPVSVPKARLIAPLLRADRPVHAVTPNRDELAALTGYDDLDAGVADLHARGVAWVWVRLGTDGSLLSGPDGRTRHAAVPTVVEDVTGAGDAMLAAWCHAVRAGAGPADAAAYAHAAAALTVASPHTVRPDLSDDLIRSLL